MQRVERGFPAAQAGGNPGVDVKSGQLAAQRTRPTAVAGETGQLVRAGVVAVDLGVWFPACLVGVVIARNGLRQDGAVRHEGEGGAVGADPRDVVVGAFIDQRKGVKGGTFPVGGVGRRERRDEGRGRRFTTFIEVEIGFAGDGAAAERFFGEEVDPREISAESQHSLAFVGKKGVGFFAGDRLRGVVEVEVAGFGAFPEDFEQGIPATGSGAPKARRLAGDGA